jgi:glucan endo-1,3-alpha-glucosidase
VAEAQCNKPCLGDPSEMCGQAWRLSLYKDNGTPDACEPSTNTTTPTPTPSPSNTTTAPVPSSTTPTEETSEWARLGCAVDSFDRILTGFSNLAYVGLTVDKCLAECESKGFIYGGVQGGTECFCGAKPSRAYQYNPNNCDVPCPGDNTETCGGGWGLELFQLVSDLPDCPVSATATLGGVLLPTGGSNGIITAGAPAKVTTLFSSTVDASETASASASSASSSSASPMASTSPSASASPSATTAPASTATAVPPTTGNPPSASGEHQVWAHHMVGNTYSYSRSDWVTDINAARAAGIDGFALNVGTEQWQRDQAAVAYSAAEGTGFKMFLSLDMTSLGCWSQSDANNLVSYTSQFAKSSAQAHHNGKVLVSTFSGSDCNFGVGGSNGWQTQYVDALKNQGVNIFFVPSIFSDVSTFSSNTWMDGELNWNSAWPVGDNAISTNTDERYMSALGGKEYMAAVSPYFFTHFGQDTWNKNWIYKGDDWLYCTRWEQIISMRDRVKQTEILTWNDYGESSYIGPIHGSLPAGSDKWTLGFDHQGLNVLTQYYATAFKTGQYPTITKDSLVMWSRPHAHDANAPDYIGRPTGWNWTDDNLYAVVLTTGPAQVTLTSGSNTQTFSVEGGLTKLKIPNAPGGMTGKVVRNGQNVATVSGQGFDYTTSPATYNFNYFVGSSS